MTKSEQLETEFRRLIGNGIWQESCQIPSEPELCQQYAVSRTTVRAALGALRAEGLVTSRPRLGTVVASKTACRTLHLVIRDIREQFAAMTAHYAHAFATSQENMMFQSHETNYSQEQEEKIVRECLEDPHSLIVLSTLSSDKTRELIRQNPTRIAILGQAPEMCGSCIQVMTDLESGAEMVMKHLLEMGHTRIGFIGSADDTDIRSIVWRRTLRRYGYPIPEGYQAYLDAAKFPDIFAQVSFFQNYLETIRQLPEPPTAVFCSSDMFAQGFLHAIYAAGKKVPEDFSLVGFDGTCLENTSYALPQLATVVQPYAQLISTIVYAMQDYHEDFPRLLLQPHFHAGTTIRKLS